MRLFDLEGLPVSTPCHCGQPATFLGEGREWCNDCLAIAHNRLAVDIASCSPLGDPPSDTEMEERLQELSIQAREDGLGGLVAHAQWEVLSWALNGLA